MKIFNFKERTSESAWQRALALVMLANSGLCLLNAQTSPDAPLISIVEPALNQTLTGSVRIGVLFGPGADPSTFSASVDGTDITGFFTVQTQCGNTTCDREAVIPESDLLNGTNIVTVNIAGPNSSEGVDRTKFIFSPPGAASETVTRLVSSVAVQSVRLAPGGDSTNIGSYQIVLGPGPGFPQRIYTAAGLSCTAGLNSLQALVLKRNTLEVEPRAGNGSGQACFGDGASFNTFVRTMPVGDLVIVNSFLGAVRGLNTSGMGGHDYSLVSTVTPLWYYTAIGAVGAPAGTAYESYQTSPGGISSLPPLIGSLMLDIQTRYYFVPSEYRELKVVPNDPAYPLNSSIIYNGQAFHQPPASGSSGSFWILAIDRRLGSVVDSYVLPTNSSDRKVSANALSDMAYLLDVYYRSDQLLVITTIGQPILNYSDVTPVLMAAINRLGGTGLLLQQLSSSNAAYTLVSSPDQGYVADHYPVESSSVQLTQDQSSATAETGELDVLLSRNHRNMWVVHSALSDDRLPQPLDSKWTEVSFQQPQDWPKWTTAGQERAYLDLTAQTERYPTLRQKLGCSGTTDVCQPVRDYYDGGMASGTTPSVLSFDFSSLRYQANADYTAADLAAVITQLSIEEGYEGNLYILYNLFRDVTSDTTSSLQFQLQQVAKAMDSSFVSNTATVEVRNMTRAAGVLSWFSGVTGVGPAFGGITALLDATAKLAEYNGTVPDDGRYAYTLEKLKEQTQLVGTDMSNSTAALFTALANDWGKLSVIGSGYGSSRSPWRMCVSCSANVPRAALPAMALAAKRQFYLQLMPTRYIVDYFAAQPQPNPAKIGGAVGSGTSRECLSAYSGAPQQDIWTYNTQPGPKWDIYILNQTSRSKDIFGRYYVYSYPSGALMTTLFSAPNLSTNPPTGGAGLLVRDLLPSHRYLGEREGYRPGSPACTLP